MVEKLTDKIAEEVKKGIEEAENSNPEDISYGEVNKAAIKRTVKPIVEEAVIPLSEQIDELRSIIAQINTAIPQSFNAVLAGTAANGALGAADYQKTQGKVQKSLVQVSKNLEEITSD